MPATKIARLSICTASGDRRHRAIELAGRDEHRSLPNAGALGNAGDLGLDLPHPRLHLWHGGVEGLAQGDRAGTDAGPARQRFDECEVGTWMSPRLASQPINASPPGDEPRRRASKARPVEPGGQPAACRINPRPD